MSRLRLLPLVLIAISCLFVLKTVGLWLDAPLLSGGVSPALAQSREANTQEAETDESPTEDQAVAGAESGNGPEQALEADTAADLPPGNPGQIIVTGQETNNARTAVLERLRGRRLQLDAYEQELGIRANLLYAAENQLEARIKELKEIEARISAAIGEREEEQQAQLAGLVTMYETMKPKDAARIFNRLDLPILIEVVSQMSARKMAVILAAMDSAAAEQLTVEIATRGRQEPFPNEQAAENSDLPKIGEDNPS